MPSNILLFDYTYVFSTSAGTSFAWNMPREAFIAPNDEIVVDGVRYFRTSGVEESIKKSTHVMVVRYAWKV